MNVRRALSLALLFTLSLTGLAAAQETGRIEGRVTRQDETPLPGVSVRIDQLDQTALTGADGRFELSGVPPGTYELSFSLVDNTATRPDVQVAAGGTANADITVDWDVSFAETITVTSVSRRAERIVEAPAAVTVVPSPTKARVSFLTVANAYDPLAPTPSPMAPPPASWSTSTSASARTSTLPPAVTTADLPM